MEKQEGVPLAASPAAIKHDVLQRAFPDLMRLEDFLGAVYPFFLVQESDPALYVELLRKAVIGVPSSAPTLPDDAVVLLQKESH